MGASTSKSKSPRAGHKKRKKRPHQSSPKKKTNNTNPVPGQRVFAWKDENHRWHEYPANVNIALTKILYSSSKKGEKKYVYTAPNEQTYEVDLENSYQTNIDTKVKRKVKELVFEDYIKKVRRESIIKEPSLMANDAVGKLAYNIVQKFRQNRRHPTIINWAFTVKFIVRFFQIADKRGIELALPEVVYHWTAVKNMHLVVDGNLKVPDGVSVFHATDDGWYGRGVYSSPNPTRFKAYGDGAKKTCMCLAVLGKTYVASYPKMLGKPLVTGYDSHVSDDAEHTEWVFFDNSQLLPLYFIKPAQLTRANDLVNQLRHLLIDQFLTVWYRTPKGKKCKKDKDQWLKELDDKHHHIYKIHE